MDDREPAKAATPKSAKKTLAMAATPIYDSNSDNENDLSFEVEPEPIPSPFELDQDLKPFCGYGKSCSQENPLHLRIYRHPKDDEGSEKEAKNESEILDEFKRKQLQEAKDHKLATQMPFSQEESDGEDMADVREHFEISKKDPKYMICTICGSRLSKGSKETTFQKHLETKKHLKELNSKNRLKLKAGPKSTKKTPAKATTSKSAKKTPAKANAPEDEPGTAKATTSKSAKKTPAKAATPEDEPGTAKATTSKSAKKTPAKAATPEEEPGIFTQFFSMLNPFNWFTNILLLSF